MDPILAEISHLRQSYRMIIWCMAVLKIPIARSPEAACFRTGLPTQEAGSPGWRPKKTISQFLYIPSGIHQNCSDVFLIPQKSVTTQIAVQKVN